MLAHLNGALLRSSPVRLGGVPVNRTNLVAIRRRVGVVRQEADDQLIMPTVGEDVAVGSLNAGVPAPEVVLRVESALDQVGPGRLKALAHGSLSGGERRRVVVLDEGTIVADGDAVDILADHALLEAYGVP